METLNNNTTIEYSALSCKKSNKNIEEVNISAFINFLEEIKKDYQNGGAQLHIALNKFEERYKAARLKSIPRLVSFLYDLNSHLDLTVNIKGDFIIRI